jgi:uncharacterized protein
VTGRRWDERLAHLIRHRRKATMPADDDILAELTALRARLPDATGTLVATIDGMLVAHEAAVADPEVLAAMSAAQLGLGRQFGVITGQGAFLESVTRSVDGCVAVFAAGPHGLLTVLAGPDLNVGRLYHEARPAAARLGQLLGAAPPAPLRHG